MQTISNKKQLKVLASMLIGLLVLGGCTMAPSYERPDMPVDGSFPEYEQYKGVGAGDSKVVRQSKKDEEESEKASEEKPANGLQGWREFYADPNMQRLVEFALDNNRDLRLALLNVENTRALYQIQRSDLFPTIAAGGSAANQRTRTFQEPLAPASAVARRYNLSVGITSYEVDLFGRVRSMNNSAFETYLASGHAAYSAQISIISEVAGLYLQLVAYKEQYELTKRTYASRQESYSMVEAMYKQGLSSQLTLNQAKTAVEEARVNAVNLYTNVLQLENALIMLLGGPIPEDVKIPARLADVKKLGDVPAGLPSSLLERRPDILQAEHQLLSANANIGAARASFFPTISLTGSLGYISGDLDDLFKKDSRTWNFTPQIGLPIFTGGALVAGLESATIRRDMAVATYEKAIQSAFREVADALAQRSTINEQLEATKSLRDASKQSYDISNVRYEIGMDSFMNVLDAQRMLFTAEQGYINSELQKEINSINLYKSLGGGWQ
ncbi:efflux transporter outer membrane subunit [Desulfovibrio sp. OttesenSCG-928-F07]|nr:efflux transporter outer membrane subunit [Desulfovibrio sp. OttesenSCG-928-F07]